MTDKKQDPHAELMQQDCTRSHPHELMTPMCELRTEIARLNHANANLRAQLEAVGAVGVGAMMSKPDIATAIHYPAHWDTAAYPTLESALSELSAWFKCSECAQPAPAVVGPMALQEVSVKHWAQRALEAQPKSDPEYWPLSYKAGHMEDELIELRAALKIAIAASPQPHQIAEPASQWLSIETAPKDGRTLLLGYFNSHKKWRTMRGKWMSEDYIAENWEEPDDGGPGWYETVVEHDNTPNCWFTEPKYWMPLPPAPKEPS